MSWGWAGVWAWDSSAEPHLCHSLQARNAASADRWSEMEAAWLSIPQQRSRESLRRVYRAGALSFAPHGGPALRSMTFRQRGELLNQWRAPFMNTEWIAETATQNGGNTVQTEV